MDTLGNRQPSLLLGQSEISINLQSTCLRGKITEFLDLAHDQPIKKVMGFHVW